MRHWMATALLGAAITLVGSGCSRTHHHASPAADPQVRTTTESRHRHGPPPHAPAHGYRHKQGDGVDLRYDSRVDAYVVLGYEDTWYVDEVYFRWTGRGWQSSVRVSGDWASIAVEKVPVRLREAEGGKWSKRKR